VNRTALARPSLALLLALAAPARAAAQDACDPAPVEALEREAQAANQQGRHEEALATFQRAYARCRGPRALARMALTEASLGRWLDADLHLREAVSRDDPWITQNRGALQVEVERIAARVGSLLVTGEGDGGEVEIDGRPAAPWPMREPVRALVGDVTVTVRAGGFVAVTRTLRITAGALTREHVTLARLPQPAPPPVVVNTPPVPAVIVLPAPSATPRSAPTSIVRVAAWSALGLAVLGVGVGATAATVRAVAQGDLEAAGCDATPPDRARCDGLADDADGARPWILGGFIAGGAFAVASALAFALAPPATRPAERAWRCGPTVGAAGVLCGGTF
jgi:hypothetical protein